MAATPLGATAAPVAQAPSGAAVKLPSAATPKPPAPGLMKPPAPPITPPPAVAAAGAAAHPDATKADGADGDYNHLVTLADRLSENGHAKEARKLYERALAAKPNGVEAIMGLGYCDLDGEKFSSAVDHFKHALSISPNFGEAIIGLAEAYKLRGDRKEALTFYKQYLAQQPDGPKAAMAKSNIRDLEPKQVTTEVKEVPAGGAPDEPKRSPATTDETKKADDTKKSDEQAPLPRLPTNDEPPP